MKSGLRYRVVGKAVTQIREVIRVVHGEEEVIRTFPDDTPDSVINDFIEKDGEKWENENRVIHKYAYELLDKETFSKKSKKYLVTKDGNPFAKTESLIDAMEIVSALNKEWEEREKLKQEKEGKVSIETKTFYWQESKALLELVWMFHREAGKELLEENESYQVNGMTITQGRKFYEKLHKFVATH